MSKPKLQPVLDPVLGPLTPLDDPSLSDILVGRLLIDGKDIEFWVGPDGEPLETCLQLARDFHAMAEELVAKARQAASAELLETYNDGWRVRGEFQPDGTVIDVEDGPVLDAAAFGARLQLETVQCQGATSLEFTFGDDGMFGGHAISVHSDDGTAFTRVYADMFG